MQPLPLPVTDRTACTGTLLHVNLCLHRLRAEHCGYTGAVTEVGRDEHRPRGLCHTYTGQQVLCKKALSSVSVVLAMWN